MMVGASYIHEARNSSSSSLRRTSVSSAMRAQASRSMVGQGKLCRSCIWTGTMQNSNCTVRPAPCDVRPVRWVNGTGQAKTAPAYAQIASHHPQSEAFPT